MNPGLVKLLKLRYFAVLRQGFRQLNRPRRAVLVVLGIGLFALWLAPSLMRSRSDQPLDVQGFRTKAPLFLLLGCLMPLANAGSRHAFQFTPAEIDFLFPGPFTRRELLVTKLITTLPGLLFGSIVLSVVLKGMTPYWAPWFVGVLLAMTLVQLFGMVVMLLQQIVAEYAFSVVRKIAIAVLVLVLVFAVVPLVSRPGRPDGTSPSPIAGIGATLLDSPVVQAITIPFQPLVRTMSAETVGEFLGWGGLALAIDLALLAAVLRLDVNFNDAAVAASQAYYRRRKQLQQRGGAGWMVLKSPRIGCPKLPWLGGAGPVARRQMTAAIRAIPGLVLFMVLFGFPMFGMVLGMRHSEGGTLAALGGYTLFFPIMLARTVPFDFRGDLEQMDWLKSLPLPAAAIAAGQLVAPVLVLTGFQWCLLAVLGLLADSSQAAFLAIAAFALPVNVMMFAVDNFIFLVCACARLHPATGVSFQFFGRTVVEMLSKVIVVGLAAAISAAPGAAVYWFAENSWIAAVALSWLIFSSISAAAVLAVAWAFRRFDVSLDVA